MAIAKHVSRSGLDWSDLVGWRKARVRVNNDRYGS